MKGSAAPRGSIGPNAIIQTVAALREQLGRLEADRLLSEWGHSDLVTVLPREMIPEGDFTRLVLDLHAGLGREASVAILDRAGRLTGDYLLTHRIPRPARWLLPRLPAPLGLAVLSRGIGAHAWTFAGSGQFRIEARGEPAFSITTCPMCRGRCSDRPDCSFYSGAFERLLQVLIRSTVRVNEIECEAAGGSRCRFRITLG